MKHILPFLFLITCFTVTAQKLPNIQPASLRAPVNIKIDGKATEWNNQFQAYNKATKIYYTLANDDKNLYLTIQVIDYGIVNKILGGGIVFTMSRSEKKNLKDGVSITYPILEPKSMRFTINFGAMPKTIPGSAATVVQADSFMNVNNNLLAEKSRLIRVTGI